MITQYLPFIIKSLVITILFILGLVTVQVFGISYPVSVTTSTRSSELAVVGEGSVEVTPDLALVRVGVRVSDVPTAEQARQQLNETNNAIIAAMEEQGIPAEDIQTSNYSIYPTYSYEDDTSSGFDGNVTIEIQARSPEMVADITNRATEAGANEIQGTEFRVDDTSVYREEAREKAIDDAREQAQKLADELGIRLGKVTNIVESSPGIPAYDMMQSRMADGSGGVAESVPDIEPGSQTIRSTVTLYFEKK